MTSQITSSPSLLKLWVASSRPANESQKWTGTSSLRPGLYPKIAKSSSSRHRNPCLTWSERRTSSLQTRVGSAVNCTLATEGKSTITFNIGETSLSVPLSMDAAAKLNEAIGKLLTTFKEKEKATRPQRWESLDFVSKGDVADGEVVFEAFCNPNAYSNAFQAKVLITARDDRMKFMSEGPLSAIKADLDEYLGQK